MFNELNFLNRNLQRGYFIYIDNNILIFDAVKVVSNIKVYFKIQIIGVKLDKKSFDKIFI